MPRVVHLTTVHRLRDPRIFYKEVGTLRQAGYDVHLVAPHGCSETVEGVPVTALPLVAGRARRVLLQRAAYRAARGLRADLYHFHDPELIPVGYALKRATGARVVYDMHENYRGHGRVQGRLLRALERWCFGWVDHVVLAEDSYAPIVAASGVPFTIMLNYFLPHAQAQPVPKMLPQERVELLYAGVQGRTRGLPVLLDLGARIQAQALPWRLTLAGACYVRADRRAAEERLSVGGLSTVVRRDGWDTYLPWPDMERYFQEAHIGLALLQPHPNYRDTLPTKFYEYLHYGLPILCADFPRWRAFVEEQGCGAAVNAGDADAVVAQVRAWTEDPAAYARLSAAAVAAAPRYHWSVMAERLLALYERLLEGRPSLSLRDISPRGRE